MEFYWTHRDEWRNGLLRVLFTTKEVLWLAGISRKRAGVVTFRPAVKPKYNVIIPTPQMDAGIESWFRQAFTADPSPLHATCLS
jgi:hypothetical protein